MNLGNNDVYAVVMQNISFGYKREAVLKNLCIQVKKGEIFALLGPSSCGKTTALKLILGTLKPLKGWVRVFGEIPGYKHSSGRTVGYMPREIALITDLTIEENMKFFAKLFHLNSQQFEDSLKELIGLCDINRRIDRLSPGQQRLVSMAVAIMHSPKLIILNEPTVNVDPFIRSRIWSYLIEFCREYGNTVIISTNCIEEANKASTVAFMKSGAILRQSNPQKLLNEYECTSLEEVYLCLWQQMDEKAEASSLEPSTIRPSIDLESIPIETSDIEFEKTDNNWTVVDSKKIVDIYRVMALIWKINLQLRRSPIFLILFIAIPISSLYFLYLAVGYIPQGIPVAIYSDELDPSLSKQFIDSIDDNFVDVIRYDTKDLAINSLKEGKNVLAIIFAQNFTKEFKLRLINPFMMTKEEMDASVIKLYTDSTHPLISFNGVLYLAQVFHQFLNNVSISLNQNSKAFTLPVIINQTLYGTHPITGNNKERFMITFNNLAPAILIVSLHLTSIIFSCFVIFNGRRDLQMNRFSFSGGQLIEVILAHYFLAIFYIFFQIFLLLVFASYVLGIKEEGSFAEVYLLCFLQSLEGLSIGLLIALAFKDRLTSMTIIFILMSTLYYMSGVFWPIEGIPPYLRVIADWTPLSKPIDSLRSIMLRAWDYTHPNVWIGFIVSFSYTLVISIFNLIFFQVHQEHFI